MWLLPETSTLPLFLVMLCYHHRQSGRTESPSRIKGARKADHLWRPRGPAARGAGCRERGGRRGSGNWSLIVNDFSDFLAACGPEQRHGWLTLVCCEGVSSSKTQVHPGLASQDTSPPWASLRKNWLYQHISMSVLLLCASLWEPSESEAMSLPLTISEGNGCFPGVPFACQIGPQHHGSRTTVIGKQGFAFCSSPYAAPRSQHTGLHLQGLTTSTAKRR